MTTIAITPTPSQVSARGVVTRRAVGDVAVASVAAPTDVGRGPVAGRSHMVASVGTPLGGISPPSQRPASARFEARGEDAAAAEAAESSMAGDGHPDSDVETTSPPM